MKTHAGFDVQILLRALFLLVFQLPLRTQRNKYPPVHFIMIKDLSLGFGRQVLMLGFPQELTKPLMVQMVYYMIRVIYIVLFVMKVVPLKYLMCPILIVFSPWINLYRERRT